MNKTRNTLVITAIGMAVSLTLGSTSWAADSATENAPTRPPEIRQDRKEIRQDRKDLRGDRRDLRQDRRGNRPAARPNRGRR